MKCDQIASSIIISLGYFQNFDDTFEMLIDAMNQSYIISAIPMFIEYR